MNLQGVPACKVAKVNKIFGGWYQHVHVHVFTACSAIKNNGIHMFRHIRTLKIKFDQPYGIKNIREKMKNPTALTAD